MQIHSNRMKNKTHVIISTDIEETSDQIQYLFTVKPPHKLEKDINYLNILKVRYEKPTGTIILNSEKWKFFI